MRAAKQLAEVIYPDTEVIDALQVFEGHRSDELRGAVHQALKTIQRAS